MSSPCDQPTVTDTDRGALKEVLVQATNVLKTLKRQSDAAVKRGVRMVTPVGLTPTQSLAALPEWTFPFKLPKDQTLRDSFLKSRVFKRTTTESGVLTFEVNTNGIAEKSKIFMVAPFDIIHIGLADDNKAIDMVSAPITSGDTITSHAISVELSGEGIKLEYPPGKKFVMLNLTDSPVRISGKEYFEYNKSAGEDISKQVEGGTTAVGDMWLSIPGNSISTIRVSLFKVLEDKDRVSNKIKSRVNYPKRAGWSFVGDDKAENFNLVTTPKVNTATDNYPVEPLAKYGPHFKNRRPPGWPKGGYHVSTRAHGLKFIREQVKYLLSTELPNHNIVIPPAYHDAFSIAFEIVSSAECGTRLYMPITTFEIRPLVGKDKDVADGTNLYDEGPFPRDIFRGKVTSKYRPTSKKYKTDCGCLQYTLATWRALSSLYGEMFNMTSPERLWVFYSRPHLQVWLQVTHVTKRFLPIFAHCAALNITFPTVYVGILTYLNNLGPVFLDRYSAKVIPALTTLTATTPQPTSDQLHLTCKAVFDGATWLGARFINDTKIRAKINRLASKVAGRGKDPGHYTLVIKDTGRGSVFRREPRLLPGKL